MVDEVGEVQPFWAQLPLDDRAQYMRRTAQVIIDRLDDLATLLAREQGKPHERGVHDGAAAHHRRPPLDRRDGPKILGDKKIPYPQLFWKQKKSWFAYEPLGVVGVIAPWNYPWSIPFGEVAIALMCGNGVVLKPASLTPLIGEQIQQRVRARRRARGTRAHRARRRQGGQRAGRVERVQDLLHGLGRGRPARRRRRGRAAQGQRARARRQGPGASCSRDADMDHTVAGITWGGFANAGQTCAGIERVYVQQAVADQFVDGLVDAAKKLRLGDPEQARHRGRPDGRPGPVRDRHRARRGRDRQGRDQALRRPGRGRRPRGQDVLRADGADRRHERHADHAGGDLRPGRARS